jgi:MarR family transcriptional regulator, organic hydroperoxide resistance regulator
MSCKLSGMTVPTEANAPLMGRFRSQRQRGVVTLLHTADAVRRQYVRLFEPYDLTPQQYNVLRILRGALPDALPTMDIADRMIDRTPGITRLLDRLVDKDLVSRERCAEDRRQVLCTISRAGLELLAELDEPVDIADDEVLATLAEAEVARLTRLLERVYNSLE